MPNLSWLSLSLGFKTVQSFIFTVSGHSGQYQYSFQHLMTMTLAFYPPPFLRRIWQLWEQPETFVPNSKHLKVLLELGRKKE